MKCNKSKLNGAEETKLCGTELTHVFCQLESKVWADPQLFMSSVFLVIKPT